MLWNMETNIIQISILNSTCQFLTCLFKKKKKHQPKKHFNIYGTTMNRTVFWEIMENMTKSEKQKGPLNFSFPVVQNRWNKSVRGFRTWIFSSDTVWGKLFRPTGWGGAWKHRCGRTELSSPRRNSGSAAAGGKTPPRNIRSKSSTD